MFDLGHWFRASTSQQKWDTFPTALLKKYRLLSKRPPWFPRPGKRCRRRTQSSTESKRQLLVISRNIIFRNMRVTSVCGVCLYTVKIEYVPLVRSSRTRLLRRVWTDLLIFRNVVKVYIFSNFFFSVTEFSTRKSIPICCTHSFKGGKFCTDGTLGGGGSKCQFSHYPKALKL